MHNKPELEVEWKRKQKNHTDYYVQNENELLVNAYFERFCTIKQSDKKSGSDVRKD
ncbi:MAG TPA: hypothetical protein P5064_01395 [Clostridia bacterium]|jgi:hypothetical protein|nr:hypothetical protein [Clostridiaceae bacterium]HOM34708.1 hypothetical protein [Clostridia bacterium]HOR90319.1 hypothetical protein [Clostridia bacterium]HOT70245.1 hypothetical protein [Clostridia bacterium]HQG00491.1 hypothetical protein [Clostridia bacterium]